eukprot:301123-Prorocentrum_minimum.AAC.1
MGRRGEVSLRMLGARGRKGELQEYVARCIPTFLLNTNILTPDQSDAGSTGIFSRRTNHTQDAQVYSHLVLTPYVYAKYYLELLSAQDGTQNGFQDIRVRKSNRGSSNDGQKWFLRCSHKWKTYSHGTKATARSH